MYIPYMRVFVLWSHAVTSPNFTLKDLPSSGKRMDLVARTIVSAMWLSHKLREDTMVYVVLNGSPEPPKTVVFHPGIKRVSPDERSIALWIQKALLKYQGRRDKEWYELNNGILISGRSFQDVIKTLSEEYDTFYLLDQKGKDVEKIELKKDAVYVLGDHKGIPKNDAMFVLRKGEKISIGKETYLTSSTVSVIQWLLDRKGI